MNNGDPLPPSVPITRTLLPAFDGFYVVSARAKLHVDGRPTVKDNHKIPVVAWLLQSGVGNMTNPVPLWPAVIEPPDPNGWIEYIGVLLPDGRVINEVGAVYKSMTEFRKTCAEARQNAYLQVSPVEGGVQ